MNLIGEEFIPPKEEKTKKTSKILLIAIVIVFVMIIAIIVLISSLKTEPLKVVLNGSTNSEIKKLLLFDDNKENVFIPIKEIAPFLDYAGYNGDYASKSEKNDMCYIERDEEAVTFTANSNTIEIINKSTKESTFVKIDEPVKMSDGKLYTTPDGLLKGFNALFSYNKEKKKINIQTLSNLIETYKEKAIEAGFDDISTEFIDAKAALKGLTVVKKNNSYGLYDMEEKKEILETKYDAVSYIPVTNSFLVKSNGKIGIVDEKGKQKIKLQYEDIEQISQDLDLYVVKKDGKYGIIDSSENIIIKPLADKIGMDIKRYEKNNIKNKYLLLDKYIPVMKNNKWALCTTDGKNITQLIYDEFGCYVSGSSNKDAQSVLVIPEEGLIVGKRDKYYYLINEEGDEIGNGISFEKVYLEVDIDKVTYNVTKSNVDIEIGKVMEAIRNHNSNNNNTSNNNTQENEEDEENHEEEEKHEENNEENQEENNEEQDDNEYNYRYSDENNESQQENEEEE